MAEEATIEQRLAAVEAAVRQLQALLPARAPAPNWLDRVIGSSSDEAAFLEAMEYGRAYRQSDRPADDQLEKESTE